ncbi:MAG: hypothetical protein KIT18_07120 [Burkholderiales bacterium]|nr:hypothetical protein [Burkholderiales bacterium]
MQKHPIRLPATTVLACAQQAATAPIRRIEDRKALNCAAGLRSTCIRPARYSNGIAGAGRGGQRHAHHRF